MARTTAASAAEAVVADASALALKQSEPTEGAVARESAAEGLAAPVQDAIKSGSDTVERALCAHLEFLFTRNTDKYSEMMISRVETHLKERPVVDKMNEVIGAALKPNIEAALASAIDDMKKSGVYQKLLETHVNAVFSTDIRTLLFDNLNSLSAETRKNLFETAVAREPGIARTALTAEAPVPTQPAPPPRTSPPVEIVDGAQTQGGARRKQKTRARARRGAKRGGARSRRQRVLTLA